MGFLTGGIFWGLVLVLFGLSIIIKVIFHIDIPVFRVVFGLLLIYLGARVILGDRCNYTKTQNVVFEQDNVKVTTHDSDYNIVFGRGHIDLTDWDEKQVGNTIDINVVFGSADIIIDPSFPTEVYVKSVFAESVLPDKKNVSIGEHIYTTPNVPPNAKLRHLDVKSVFSSVKIIEKPRPVTPGAPTTF